MNITTKIKNVDYDEEHRLLITTENIIDSVNSSKVIFKLLNNKLNLDDEE